jgi:DNA-directed RNA polymerase specialized sigma24 family protein
MEPDPRDETKDSQSKQQNNERDRQLVERYLNGDNSVSRELLANNYIQVARCVQRYLGRCPLLRERIDYLTESAFRLAFLFIEEYTSDKSFAEFTIGFLRREIVHLLKQVRAEQAAISETSLDALPEEPIANPEQERGPVEYQIQTLLNQEAYKVFAEFWCGLSVVNRLIHDLNSIHGIEYEDILELDVERTVHALQLALEEQEALSQIKRLSLVAIKHRGARAKTRLYEGGFKLRLEKECREADKDDKERVERLAILDQLFVSPKERFVLRQRLVGKESFQVIARHYNREFGENVVDTEMENVYFTCVAQYLESRGPLTVSEFFEEIHAALRSR